MGQTSETRYTGEAVPVRQHHGIQGYNTFQSYVNVLTLRMRIFIFVSCVTAIWAQDLAYTLPLPFMIDEVVEKRGCSSSMAGAVFGSFCLSLTITMGFSQYWSRIITCRNALLVSIVVFAFSTPPFYLKLNNTAFLVLLFISRILQGICIGICDIQLMGAMSLMFPNKLSLVSSVYELAFSFALITGPAMGGYLYKIGGFWLPMNILTAIYIPIGLVGVVAASYVPEDNTVYDKSSLKQLLILPVLVLGVMSMMTLSLVATFIEAFFGNYVLTTYNITEDVTGLIITLAGVFYTISTGLSGFLGERYKFGRWMIIIGLIIMWLSSSCIDLTYMGIKRFGLWWPSLMYSMFEVGSGLVQVSLLPVIIIHYQNSSNLPENVATCHMSGIYSSMFFLGSFLGPILGGTLHNYLPYCWTFFITGLFFIVNLTVVVVCQCWNKDFLNPVVIKDKPYSI